MEVRVVDGVAGPLNFIRIDFQTRLQIGAWEVVIEGPFTLTCEGRSHRLHPNQRELLGPLLAVFPDTMQQLTIQSDASLCLEFASGSTIVVPPTADYEAWSLVGPGTKLLVCLPGTSGIAEWS